MRTVSFYTFVQQIETHLQDSKQKGTPEWPKRKMRLYVKQVMGVNETRRTSKPDGGCGWASPILGLSVAEIKRPASL